MKKKERKIKSQISWQFWESSAMLIVHNPFKKKKNIGLVPDPTNSIFFTPFDSHFPLRKGRAKESIDSDL